MRHLQEEVELHVAPLRIVRVLAQDELERRRSLVDVAVLEQEVVTGVGARHQLVLVGVVAAGITHRVQKPEAASVARFSFQHSSPYTLPLAYGFVDNYAKQIFSLHDHDFNWFNLFPNDFVWFKLTFPYFT